MTGGTEEHNLVMCMEAVRRWATDEYTDEDAVAAMMMEEGARESVLRDGERVTLPLSGDLESEQLVRDQLRTKLGVDPLDIEAVMEISFPRP